MEKIIEYVFTNLDIHHYTAPIVALITSLGENKGKSKSFAEYLITVFLSMSVAGIIIEYLPAHTIFIGILVGILSGVLIDDLYIKLVEKFPRAVDDLFDTLIAGLKHLIKKWFGDDKNE